MGFNVRLILQYQIRFYLYPGTDSSIPTLLQLLPSMNSIIKIPIVVLKLIHQEHWPKRWTDSA